MIVELEDEDIEKILEHHGVKGQKWGVTTKSRRGSGSKRESHSSRAKNLSDDDLQRLIKRMNLEKQFVDLSKNNSKAGATFVKKTLASSGNTLIKAFVTAGATAAVGKAFKSASKK